MQSVTARKIIALVFALVVLLRGAALADTIEGIVAVVDDRLIMRSDLNARMEILGLDPDNHALALRVLDVMVEDIIVTKTYQRFGLPPLDQAQISAVANQNKTDLESAQGALMRKFLTDMMVSSRVVVTPQMVKAYYDATPLYSGRLSVHLKQIAIQGDLARASAPMSKIKAGKTFDEVAKEHSDILSGGTPDIGWVAVEDLDPAARTVVEKAKPGDVLAPVQIKDYACIFQVVAREFRGTRDLEEVRAEITEKLENQIREEAFDHWLKQTMAEHFIGIYL